MLRSRWMNPPKRVLHTGHVNGATSCMRAGHWRTDSLWLYSCTFHNDNTVTSCGMCTAERPWRSTLIYLHGGGINSGQLTERMKQLGIRVIHRPIDRLNSHSAAELFGADAVIVGSDSAVSNLPSLVAVLERVAADGVVVRASA